MELEIPGERSLGWAQPKTQRAPEPSYAPFLLALGITMLFWGLVTSPVMSAAGFAVFAWAAWMWIRQIVTAWRN